MVRLFLAFLAVANVVNAEENKARFRISKQAAAFCNGVGNPGRTAQIFVNDIQVCKVDAINNQRITDDDLIDFVPSDTGKNKVCIVVGKGTMFEERTQPFEFDAAAGDTVVFGLTSDGKFIGRRYFITLDSSASKPCLVVTDVKLDSRTTEREIASEIIEILPGIKRGLKRTKTIEHSITITDTESISTELKAEIQLGIVSIGGAIKGKVEKSIGQTFKESESIEQSIEVDGSILQKVRLVWVQVEQTGTATIERKGVRQHVKFTFRKQLELRAQKP